MTSRTFEQEVHAGERFEFGKNWSRFLALADEERIDQACKSIRTMLERQSLEGLSFLDVGSGSGLFSLAAKRLGAARVHSFDYDPHSVACTSELKRRFFPHATEWTIERGSALEAGYVGGLGQFDVVYSWGVLHHTGDMWRALETVVPLVKPGGALFIAIYRDQGWRSRVWRAVKRLYNGGVVGRLLMTGIFCPLYFMQGLLADLFRLRNPVRRYREYKKNRGMSQVHNWIDWIGGYPFEVATPDEICDFYRKHGFALERLTTVLGHGCNEYLFTRRP